MMLLKLSELLMKGDKIALERLEKAIGKAKTIKSPFFTHKTMNVAK